MASLQVSNSASALQDHPIHAHGLDPTLGVALGTSSPQATLPTSAGARTRLNIMCLPSPPSIDLPDSIRFVDDQDNAVDAILLSGTNGRHLLTSRISKAAAAIVPIIDASGQSVDGAEFTLPILTPATLMLALQSLAPVIERVRSLPKSLLESSIPGFGSWREWPPGAALPSPRGMLTQSRPFALRMRQPFRIF